MTQNGHVVPLLKIQLIILLNVHDTKTKDIVFLETKEKPTKILKHYSLEKVKLI